MAEQIKNQVNGSTDLANGSGLALAADETSVGVEGLPWYVDGIKNEGSYGDGPDTGSGFESFGIFTVDGELVADTLNSTLTTVEVDSNDDEHFAWDRIGRANIDLIVNAVNDHASLIAERDALYKALQCAIENIQGIMDGTDIPSVVIRDNGRAALAMGGRIVQQ